MFLAYAVAAIVGGVLLVASLVSGHHDGGGAHHHGEADAASGVTSVLLSLRFWVYLLGIGGGTGLALETLAAELGAALIFGLALGVGAGSGLTASLVLRRAATQAGGVVDSRELVYRLGTLLLPAGPGRSSQVRVTINNQTVDLIAVTDDPAIAEREQVIILDIKDGIAHVTRNQPKEDPHE